MPQIESDAFGRAALRSESYRIQALLGLLGVLLVYAAARGLVTRQFRLLFGEALLLGLAVAYKVSKLVIIRGALRWGRPVRQTTWAIAGILVETQIPTLALFISIEGGLTSPNRMLVAPAMLVYFLFIILSTLRLSPGLSLLTGLLSALGYLAVTFYALTSNTQAGGRAQSPVAYLVYAGFILVGGAVAAFVAGQVRAHVAAALREVELQSELERVKHDLDIARSIQQGLLPARPPELEGFEVAGWNKPAEETGGDYFDWQTLPDGRVALSLADATGHGIGPALVGTSCRAYARASFLDGGGHDGVLDRLNRLLSDDLESNRFVTFAVVFIDPASARVEVLSAGHGPILWYRRAADCVERLEAQGIPLGMIAGIGYERGTDGRLAPGDILALVTDGFYEWENPEGEEFGVARLEAVLRESRDRPAEELITTLRSAVTDFCKGTRQMDDLTVVILKRKVETFAKGERADAKLTFSLDLQAQTHPEVPALQAGARS
ncbi:MAG: PP2C family protein-serine/threonine phosphatase [Pyrinomonadaceae bacterium]